jgi:alpha-tubulin suppressor-like RCC1 family protein
MPGDHGSDPIPTPVRLPGIVGVRQVAVGFWYTCAITADQEIYCWGIGGYWLGIGPNVTAGWVDTPTRVEWRPALQ